MGKTLRESEDKVIRLDITEALIYKSFTSMRYKWGFDKDNINRKYKCFIENEVFNLSQVI